MYETLRNSIFNLVTLQYERLQKLLIFILSSQIITKIKTSKYMQIKPLYIRNVSKIKNNSL